MDFIKETDLILDEILYCDFRTEVDTDKAKTIIRRALKKVYIAGQQPPNKVVEDGQAKYSLKPCPCTAIGMTQCGEWCFYYPPAT